MVSGAPQLVPHDAERRLSLGNLLFFEAFELNFEPPDAAEEHLRQLIVFRGALLAVLCDSVGKSRGRGKRK